MIIGVGLSRTGTTSLNKALNILGIKSIHYHPHLLKNALWGKSQNFKVYENFDAVTDLPAAYFYKEISNVYQNSKLILTIRDENEWYASVSHHYKNIDNRINSLEESLKKKKWLKKVSRKIREVVYGSAEVTEDYITKYNDHNNELKLKSDLIMDITKGDGWQKLCHFLNKPVPKIEFPFENKKFKQIKIL
jgi:hypothetical protein